MIRGKNGSSAEFSGVPPQAPRQRESKASLLSALPFKKHISVGVNIGYTDLKCVKIGQTAEKKQEVLDYRKVPFPPDISIDSPKFVPFLKSVLSDFCGSSKHIEIWSAISSARVETRFLRIPKVSKKQIANAVFWSYKKEVSLNEQNEVFDFEVIGDKEVDGVKKTEVMAYSAPREEIQQLERLFSKSGYSLTGITIIPFVIQNLLRSDWIQTEGNNLCSLYIGRDWSRIDIFSNKNLILSRGIKAGIKSIIEAIRQHVYKSTGEFSIELTETGEMDGSAISEEFDEITKDQTEHARRMFFDFIKAPASPSPSEEAVHLDEHEVFDMTLPAMERLIRQVDRTLEHYSLNFGGQTVSKIYISGLLSSKKSLVNFIGDQLGLPIDVLDPFAGKISASRDIRVPESLSERESFVPAMGMALSDKAFTPNFIFTHRDKEKLERNQRINMSVFAGLVLLMACCLGFYLWQGSLIAKKKGRIYQLQQEIAKKSPNVDQRVIQQLIAQTMQKQQKMTDVGKRYAGIAVINEIAGLTPSTIRLSSIVAELGSIPEKKDKSKTDKRILIIDGIITGDRLAFESTLAGYFIKLKESPLFARPNIKKQSFDIINGKEVMRFTAEVEFV